MADTIKTSAELKWDLMFSDGDTRAVTLKNPRSSLALSDVSSVMSAHGNVFIGDVNGAPYTGFTNARKINKTTRDLDLSAS